MSEDVAAELVAARALRVPGVAGLHGGMFGEVATYLPGRRLLGVRVTDTGCAVHVVVTYPHHVVEVAEAVHRAVEPLVTVPVTVTVEDVTTGDVGTEGVGTGGTADSRGTDEPAAASAERTQQ